MSKSLGNCRRFSFTSISTYSQCPYQWYYRYVLRDKEPQSPEQKLGNTVHSEFEDAIAGRIPMPARVAPYAEAIEDLKDGGRRVLSLEQELGITREGTATTPKAYDCKFTIKADVVLRPAIPGKNATPEERANPVSGTAYYLDWKTGKPGWEKVEQLDWTAVVLRANYGCIKRVAARLIYPLQEEKIVWPEDGWRVLDHELMDDAQRELFRSIAAIEETETKWIEEVPDNMRSPTRAKAFFQPLRSGRCVRCSIPTCEYSKEKR